MVQGLLLQQVHPQLQPLVCDERFEAYDLILTYRLRAVCYRTLTASPSRSATVANQPIIHDLCFGGVLSKKDCTGLIKRWQPRSFYITREGTLWWTRPAATGAGAAAVPANSPQALMPPDAPSCTVVGLVVNAEDGHALGFDLLTSTTGDSKGDASAAAGAVLPMHVRAETVELKREWVRYVQQLVKEHTAAVRLRQQQQQQQH